MDAPTLQALGLVIAAVGSVIGALTGFGAMLLSIRNATKIQEVHDLSNSMKDELVAEVRKSAKAEGVAEGEADAKGEAAPAKE